MLNYIIRNINLCVVNTNACTFLLFLSTLPKKSRTYSYVTKKVSNIPYLQNALFNLENGISFYSTRYLGQSCRTNVRPMSANNSRWESTTFMLYSVSLYFLLLLVQFSCRSVDSTSSHLLIVVARYGVFCKGSRVAHHRTQSHHR